MATIAFFDVHDWEKAHLKKKLSAHKCLFFSESISKTHIPKIKNVQAVSLFVHSKLPNDIIEQLPKLKMVALRSTGFDNVDLSFTKSKGIAVCNVPFYGENTVAEHTFGLILSLARKIHVAHEQVLKKNFSTANLTGFDLKGKTLGVIGGGHIGMHVVRMARAFDMNVLVYDVRKDTFMSEVLGFEYAPLNTVLKKSDVITCHAPDNKYTHHIINEKNIKFVKKGTMFVNTARGGLIDNHVLIKALKDGTFSMAGIDVLEGEAALLTKQTFRGTQSKELKQLLKENKELCDMPNVLFTPHNAFNSSEALYRILDTSIENLQTGLKGKFQNQVNK